ncbi:MAG: MBL fold metallo-hydrolase [Dehalococcoidia bacterium]|nr:MBL fold metallo-hydrolase [Dehalococcoidia bacterium]
MPRSRASAGAGRKERPMQISPSVRAVQVPDESPMHPMYTNIYLVGRDQVLTVDSGEALDHYRWMLRGYLAATEHAEIALAAITHHHSDHSGNLKWASEVLKAEVAVHNTAVPLLRGKLPARDKVRLLATDEVIDMGGGVRPRVLFSPGHSVDSVVYYLEDEGVLFTGDTLLGSSTTTVNALGPYRRSLKMLVALPNLKVICPGHGAIVNDPRERLQGLIAHRDMRERQILELLDDRRPRTPWEIMLAVYPQLDTRLRRAATGNVEAHLRDLAEQGRVLTHPGKASRPNPLKRAREVEHAKQVQRTLRAAKALEAKEKREQLRLQETPPTAQWAVQPTYEIVGHAAD